MGRKAAKKKDADKAPEAKAKKPASGPPPSADDFVQELAKEYDSSLVPVTEWLSTGIPALNKAMSGSVDRAIPVGRITEIFGLEASGKSSFLEHVYADCRKRLGGVAVDDDTERTRDEARLQQLGMEPGDLVSPRLDPGSLEQHLEMLRAILRRTKGASFPTVVGVDTVSTLVPADELKAGIGEREGIAWGQQGRLWGDALKQLVGILPESRVALVLVNQLKLSEKNYQVLESTTAGKAIRFWATIRVKLLNKGRLKDPLGNVIGYRFLASIAKNKLAPPHREAMLILWFDSGIDPIASTFATLELNNLLKTAGSWTLVHTRTHKQALYPRAEHRYDMWHALVAKDPTLHQSALDLLWDPEAPKILAEGYEVEGKAP